MSLEQVKNRPGVRLSVSEAIAALALVATVFSISQAWWILPEKVSRVEIENEKQEARLQKIESVAADRAETLARIDERTKRIEQILAARP
jgi:hypothetical protein